MRMNLTDSGSSRAETSSPAVAKLVQRFESDWQGAVGRRPDPEEYLPENGEDRAAALLAILRADLVLRWSAHEQCPIESYRQRFPDLDGDRLVALVYEEYSLREEAGE